MSSKNGYTVTRNLNQISLLASVSFTTLLAPKYGHQASQLSTVSRQSTKEFMRKSNAEKLNRMEVQSDKTKITFILLLILKICVCHPPPSNLDNGKKNFYIFQLAVPLAGQAELLERLLVYPKKAHYLFMAVPVMEF